MIALLAIALLAQSPCVRSGERCRGGRNGRASGHVPPLFEFAPSSGAGMTTACACTNPTGSKGEALTFTRASSGTCLSSGTVSGIVNGNMATCSTDQARIMPGGDGSGPLGLLVEGARTNSTIRSQELTNVVWADSFTGAAAPTRTLNHAVAPDGTTTAERIQFPATTAGQRSQLQHGSGASCPVGAASGSIFVKGTSGSGTLDFCNHNGTAWTCSDCAYVAASWTRCSFSNITQGASNEIDIGNSTQVNGGTVRSANDVLLWGAQCENGVSPSSYVATTSAAVARALDAASFGYTAAGATFSAAATWVAPGVIASNVFLHLYKDSNNSTKLSISSAKVRGTYRIGGSDSTQDTAGSVTVGAPNAVATYYDTANKTACLAGACTAASATLTLPTGAQTLYVGADQAGANHAFGVVKGICADPSASRCR